MSTEKPEAIPCPARLTRQGGVGAEEPPPQHLDPASRAPVQDNPQEHRQRVEDRFDLRALEEDAQHWTQGLLPGLQRPPDGPEGSSHQGEHLRLICRNEHRLQQIGHAGPPRQHACHRMPPQDACHLTPPCHSPQVYGTRSSPCRRVIRTSSRCSRNGMAYFRETPKRSFIVPTLMRGCDRK